MSEKPDQNQNQKLLKARPLKPGDRVAIVAPASRPARPSDLQKACRVVEAMGFVPVVGKNVMSVHGYMAGTDEERLADINWALTAADIAAVWSISGGFGAIRLIDRLPYDTFRANPKIIIGADDFNLILLALYKKCGVITFSAPNLERIDNADSLRRIKSVLSGDDNADLIVASNFPQDFCYAPVEGTGRGRILPANLTALVSLFGTAYEPDLEGSILLLEDRSERNDILDRWLTTLYISGKLATVNAVGFGQFEKCDSRGAFNMLSFEELATDRLINMQMPCCFNLAFGQSAECQVVPVGIEGTLDTKKGKLVFSETALEN